MLQENPNHECVQCGFCCRVGTCAFGIWDSVKEQCVFLTDDDKCDKYDEIIKDPRAVDNPAFGSGCSSSLFNACREAKIREMG